MVPSALDGTSRLGNPAPVQHVEQRRVTDALPAHMRDTSALTTTDQRPRFEALVLPLLDRLLSFAVRRCESVADAEDALQDACIRAWARFDNLRDDASVRPWMYRILRTVIADARDKAGRRQVLVDITRLEDAHERMIGSERDALFTEVVARLDGEALRHALTMIPDDFATAVELHDIDGFKYAEIAEIAGVPIGTVMSRISRGRKLLAGVLVTSPAGRLQLNSTARADVVVLGGGA